MADVLTAPSSAAYFFGQNTAQIAQQAPLALLGGPGLVPETSAASILRHPETTTLKEARPRPGFSVTDDSTHHNGGGGGI